LWGAADESSNERCDADHDDDEHNCHRYTDEDRVATVWWQRVVTLERSGCGNLLWGPQPLKDLPHGGLGLLR
jgi:hypothetical protein